MRVTCWHVSLTATLSRVTRGLKMMDTSCTLARSSLLLRVTTKSSVQQLATSPHRAMLLKPSTIWLSLSVRDTRINAIDALTAMNQKKWLILVQICVMVNHRSHLMWLHLTLTFEPQKYYRIVDKKRCLDLVRFWGSFTRQ